MGRTRAFTIYDEDDTLSVIKRLMDRHRVSPKVWTPRGDFVCDLRMRATRSLRRAEYATLAQTPLAKAVAPIYGDLDAAFRAANAVEFRRPARPPRRIARRSTRTYAERYEKRFRVILVDEYQDTNRAQYELVASRRARTETSSSSATTTSRSTAGAARTCATSSISSATIPRRRSCASRRTTGRRPQVLALANAVISENAERRGKILRATRRGGDPVALVAALDDRDEADYIAAEIECAGPGTTNHSARTRFSIVPTRRAACSKKSLRRRAIPYRLVGAVRFYDRREIKDLLAWLRLIANPGG